MTMRRLFTVDNNLQTQYALQMIKNTPFAQIIYILIIFSLTSFLEAGETPQTNSVIGDGTLRRIHVPILMYHYVSELPPDANAIRTNLTLSPQIFRDHIQFLENNGYTSISLYEMHLALEFGQALPSNPVILTFDDGYIDHYTNVFPLLQAHNMVGTFFIATDFVDNNVPGYMNWEQIKEMADAGMSMEPHTKSHSDLRDRDFDFLVYQIVGSIESLASHTGQEPAMFAYPIGNYDQNTLDVLRTTGIARAVTTQFGSYHTTDNRLEVPRLRITNETGVAALNYLLTVTN